MTSPLTIVAEFRIPAEHRNHFLELCAYDSAHSVADESGCQRFEAVCPLDDPQTVILVEVYDDEAAFETHLATPISRCSKWPSKSWARIWSACARPPASRPRPEYRPERATKKAGGEHTPPAFSLTGSGD